MSTGIPLFFIYLIGALSYASIGIYLYHCLTRAKAINQTLVMAVLGFAFCCHAFLLYPNIATQYGLNFNLFNTLSLSGLFLLLFFMGFSLYRPIISLGLLAAPTALLGMSAGVFGKAAYAPLIGIPLLLESHIILSFAAYCVLLMAAVQAVMLKLQLRELKHQTIHRFWVGKLPALQTMEELLFDMLLLGFVLLSLALGLGLSATYDVRAQHLTHKLAFSVVSWLLFGGLIIGHYKNGWTIKRATNMTLYGFTLLAIGFIGTKAVLELILGR